MSRIKTILGAPRGVSESVIDGTYYWPEADERFPGRETVETTNADHVRIMKQHGYDVLSQVEAIRPARDLGPIDVEEMGRTGLADALNARGVSFDQDGTRADLVETARAWNASRRQAARGEGVVAPPRPAPVAQAEPVAAAPVPAVTDGARDEKAEADRPDAGLTRPPATFGAAPVTEPEPKPKGAAISEKLDSDPAVNFDSFDYEDLKGWLASRGVGYPPRPKRELLVKIAADYWAETRAKAA